MSLQVTLFDKNNKYRPISTLVNVSSMEEYKANPASIQKKAIENICHQRRTLWSELKASGYTLVKVRDYDKAMKIEMIKKIAKRRGLNDESKDNKDND